MVISQIGCLPSWRKVKCSIFIGFLKILYCIMFTQQIQSLFVPQTLREFSFLWLSMKVHASPNLNIFHSLGSTAHWCTWIQQLVLDTYPDYFMCPLHISGSVVESLFSQYKYSAGGKLDTANYANSICAHLVKQCIAPHHSGKHCRDESATFMELPLTKQQYNKSSSN